MANELRLNLFDLVPGKPGEVINTLYRPTGEFDLVVEMSASSDGQNQVTVYFDGFRVASFNSAVVTTISTERRDDSRNGMGEASRWTVDQDEAALWVSSAGLTPDDPVGVIREIEAAALVAWEHLATVVRHAQTDREA